MCLAAIYRSLNDILENKRKLKSYLVLHLTIFIANNCQGIPTQNSISYFISKKQFFFIKSK